MKIRFTLLFLLAAFVAKSQLTWTPDFIQETSSTVTIMCDPAKGNLGLASASPFDIYVHIGVITNLSTSSSDWKYVRPGSFNATVPTLKCGTPLSSPTRYPFTISSNLRSYFGLTNANEKILKIAILFRNGNGTLVQRNANGSDMYIPVYDNGLYARIDVPAKQPLYVPQPEVINYNVGDAVPITGVASQSANLTVYYNSLPINTTTGTTISANGTATGGINTIVVSANGTSNDTVKFFVTPNPATAPVPAGMKDGINYNPLDATQATLVLYAPLKTKVALIGDFNNWEQTLQHQLFKDGDRWWITLTGLTPGTEYGFQYLIDGNLRVTDMYTEKVLDPWNDQYISATTYPNLKPYPAGQSGIVGIIQTNKPVYNWNTTNFNRPDKRNLLVYELLVRDFSTDQSFKAVKDSLGYLKRLGINAIHLLPVNEFEGNISWGYNPDFFFAPDKAYGTETALKELIDAAHANGIAIILDAVFNHATGLSPTAAMWWNSSNNKTAANNPYHNVDATHPFSVFHDFNHNAQCTKDLVDRYIEYWLTNFKVDGFRWDLSKGFTQKVSGDVNAWNQYDADRIATWKRIYNKMQAVSPNSYCILEHLSDNAEEKELADYGMMPWGNMNNDYTEVSMGFNRDLSWGVSDNRGYVHRHLLTYQESHDEERMMYKNLNFGNSSGGYNVRALATALKRQELSTALFATQPGPKMIWQFGELGYDQSRNRCPNGTVGTGDNCKTDPKPVLWNYYQDVNRRNVYNTYAKLFRLRTYPQYNDVFISGTYTGNLTGIVKQQTLVHSNLSLVTVANFDVVSQNVTLTFPATGTWYDALNNNATYNVTSTSMNVTLQPGEYHVYTNANVAAALPLNLISFKGTKTKEYNSLTWITDNEKNVSHFEIERSFDGNEYTKIDETKALNSISKNNYAYQDYEVSAVNNKETVYYRLKIMDKDGSYIYSNVIALKPQHSNTISVYPNPVKGGSVYIKFNEEVRGKVSVKINDVNGKTVAVHNVSANGTEPIKISTSNFTRGLYTLQVITENNVATSKLIIE